MPAYYPFLETLTKMDRRLVPVEWDGTGWCEGEVNCVRVVVGGEAVVGARGAAIADPAGGAVVDAEARDAIGAMLAALRKHGLVA